MRLNKFLALYSNLSRRSADKAIEDGRVFVNQKKAKLGDKLDNTDNVYLDGVKIRQTSTMKTIILNKPKGYVCSRKGQGSRTVYELLPPEFKSLNCVGRLDKDSSGLLIFTNDGDLANKLTHPKYNKKKTYLVKLNKSLTPLHQQMISDIGITLEDGPSRFIIQKLDDDKNLKIEMAEGRNRQIRRTFSALGYEVTWLHRTQMGDYSLANLTEGKISVID